MFKSASYCRWVIKCFTQCMVLYCILCSKINLKYFFYEVIKSKAWIYIICFCCFFFLPILLLVAWFSFTMGVNNKLGHSHASGGFPHVCHVSLGCVPIQNWAPGSCAEKKKQPLVCKTVSTQRGQCSLRHSPKRCEAIYSPEKTATPKHANITARDDFTLQNLIQKF